MKSWVAVAILALVAAACDGVPTAVGATPGSEVGIVVSSSDRVATIFVADSPQSAVHIGLGPDGTPVTVAARGSYAVVPLGTLPAAAIVDLRQRRLAATVALPLNSGATGVAFISDSIALVANPGLNSVTPVNVIRGTAGAEIAVGTYPQAVAAVRDTAYVLNGELGPDFTPARTGTITVLAGSMPRVIGTIELSGRNPLAAVIGDGGELYVLNAGSFGAGDGSLSTVDRGTMRETRHDMGFGDFPGALARDPDGNIYVGSFAFGIAVWQSSARTFVRRPTNAIEPGGVAANSGLGVDAAGRLYALKPECSAPSRAFRLRSTFDIELEIPTGICPFGIAFARLPAST
jgi:hypothetical protein